ncbi:MAG: hypothetical protein ACTIJ9_13855 [Aequorivita sp.]
MKNSEKAPLVKLKKLVKGSIIARNLTLIYVLISLTMVFKMRDQIVYVIPLLLGAILISWYTLTHLLLKNINLENNDLKNQFKLYRSHILKREKYEGTVAFIWFLTILPAYIYGVDIDISTLIKWLVVVYGLNFLGDRMFKKTKRDLKEIEQQINNLDLNNLE